MNIGRYIRRIIKRISPLNKLLIRVSVWGLLDTLRTGEGSDFCLSKGFLPLPVHFYSPVPDLNDMEARDIWNVKSELPGINFNKSEQLQLIAELGQRYNDECNWPDSPTSNLLQFYTNNPTFGGGCAAVCHSIIRQFKPKTVIEIGSGMSSIVIDSALKMNDGESSNSHDYLIVDPYPLEFVERGLVATRLQKERVELLDVSFIDQLEENDVLFIDSGHSVKMGGDVNYLYLELIPRLPSGVIIHIHDIRLPYEYSKRLATNKTFRQFWTEQYLLQAFLCFNDKFKILLALNFLMVDHREEFRAAFSSCQLGDHPSSFWMKKL